MSSPRSKPPTTFVQTDRAAFRDLVQKLTGLTPNLSPSKLPASRRSPFKLHERRRAMRNKLEIKLGLITSHRRRHSPEFAPSPVTPLGPEVSVFFSGGVGDDDSSAADTPQAAAVAEKLGFLLLPSPVTTPRGSDPPELLPLFPVKSPKEAR